MGSFEIGSVIGTGGVGILAAAILVSEILNTGLAWMFGTALVVFVIVGAVALITRKDK